MGNKSNFWSINTMCTHYIASELHPSLPHLFTILCSILCFLIFSLLFTAAFSEVEPTEKHKSLSIYVPCHKKKKLYAWMVFKTLKIQLYDSSIDTVRLASKDREILSWFVTMLKKPRKISSGEIKKDKHSTHM